MNLTKHAKIRQRQRGMGQDILDIILRYGRVEYQKGDSEKIFLGKRESNEIIRELKHAIKLIERSKGGTVILAQDQIVTVYKRS